MWEVAWWLQTLTSTQIGCGAIFGKQILRDPNPSKEGYEKPKEIDY